MVRNLHVNRVRHAFCVPNGLNPTSVKPVMPHMWPPRVPHRVAWLIPLQPAIFTYSRGLVGWDWVCDWRGGFPWDAGVRALQVPHFIVDSLSSMFSVFGCALVRSPLCIFYRLCFYALSSLELQGAPPLKAAVSTAYWSPVAPLPRWAGNT